MLQTGSNADLAFEAADLFFVLYRSFENFHRNITLKMLVFGLPHSARCATPDLAQQTPTPSDQFAGTRSWVDLLTGHIFTKRMDAC